MGRKMRPSARHRVLDGSDLLELACTLNDLPVPTLVSAGKAPSLWWGCVLTESGQIAELGARDL